MTNVTLISSITDVGHDQTKSCQPVQTLYCLAGIYTSCICTVCKKSHFPIWKWSVPWYSCSAATRWSHYCSHFPLGSYFAQYTTVTTTNHNNCDHIFTQFFVYLWTYVPLYRVSVSGQFSSVYLCGSDDYVRRSSCLTVILLHVVRLPLVMMSTGELRLPSTLFDRFRSCSIPEQFTPTTDSPVGRFIFWKHPSQTSPVSVEIRSKVRYTI